MNAPHFDTEHAALGNDHLGYRVCNRLLDVETNEHCEWDGDIDLADDGSWRCPACGRQRWSA